MLISTVVAVAIGLAALFLTFSMFCTAVNEVFANLTQMRGRMLVNTLKRLIDNETLRDNFFTHGLITSSALAAHGAASPADASGQLRVAPNIAPDDFAKALLDSLSPDAPPADGDGVRTLITDELKGTMIGRVLLSCLADATADLTTVRSSLAHWYDTTMAQLTDTFKRRMGWIGLGFGLILACALNVDALQITQSIMSSDQAQTDVMRLAEEVKNLYEAKTTDGTYNTAKQTAGEESALESSIQEARSTAALLSQFPIGWQGSAFAGLVSFEDWLVFLILKAIGFSISAIAVSFGAPRWYDLLVLLTGGKKPAEPDSTKPAP